MSQEESLNIWIVEYYLDLWSIAWQLRTCKVQLRVVFNKWKEGLFVTLVEDTRMKGRAFFEIRTLDLVTEFCWIESIHKSIEKIFQLVMLRHLLLYLIFVFIKLLECLAFLGTEELSAILIFKDNPFSHGSKDIVNWILSVKTYLYMISRILNICIDCSMKKERKDKVADHD